MQNLNKKVPQKPKKTTPQLLNKVVYYVWKSMMSYIYVGKDIGYTSGKVVRKPLQVKEGI